MEHGGALATGACMLDGDSAKNVRFHRCREIDNMGQRTVLRLGCRRLNVGCQASLFCLQRDSTACAVTGGRNRFGEGLDLSVVVLHEVEINGLGMLRGTDDAEAIAREGLGIKLQADVHILTCGRAEALTCGLGRIDIQDQRHIAILAFSRRIHQSCTSLSLQQAFAHSPIEALAIFPLCIHLQYMFLIFYFI